MMTHRRNLKSLPALQRWGGGAILFFAAGLFGCDRAQPPTLGLPKPLPIAAEPSRCDFGEVKPRSRHEKTVTLTNTSAQPLEVVRLEASCECLTAEPRRFTLAPGQTLPLKLILDLAVEPKFVGLMRVDLEGFTAVQVRALHVQADVAVVGPASGVPGALPLPQPK